MKRFLLATSIVLMLSSTAALAAPRNDHGDHDRYSHDRDHRGDSRDHDWNGQRDGRDWHDQRDHGGYHDNGRHLGWYKHGYRRGDRAPVVYLQPRYYVNDYRAYRLTPPPRGYRWVRPVDGHYLLVAIATGVIIDALGY